MREWWKRLMTKTNSKNRITVDFSESDKKSLEEAATGLGQSISQFVRNAVSDRVSRVRAMGKMAHGANMAADQAFASLDEEDRKDGMPGPEQPKEKPKVAAGVHPCVHLDPSFRPSNFSAREIPGTCMKQGRKPCHYHGSSAFRCPLFAPNQSAARLMNLNKKKR